MIPHSAAYTTPTPSFMDLISSDLAFFSQEGKLIASTTVKAMNSILHEKDHINEKLQSKVYSLQNKINKLEDQLDDVAQYEGRDTIMISDSAL